jgi:hypothetical protein
MCVREDDTDEMKIIESGEHRIEAASVANNFE